ncbi:MAG: hypothetical protein IIB44_05820 [Candidatus Marinimicrobia bacterium]|nr:hypothetical protein [Candidatus Neomarinimicrobiota bacterium]
MRLNTGIGSFRITTFFLLFSLFFQTPGLAQKAHRSVRDIEEEWKKHTTYQKKELLGFCDFLFDEEYYERAILAYFRYIFLYPMDDLLPDVYYKIALSYEYQGNVVLALDYYHKVQLSIEPESSEYMSSGYKITYLHLLQSEYQIVYSRTENTRDPYLLVFKGYALLGEHRWEEAKEEFRRVRTLFKVKDYDRNLARLMRACDAADELPKRNKTLTAVFSIIPGGGRAYHQDWYSVAGQWISTLGLGLQLSGGSSQIIPKFVPLISLICISGFSVMGSLNDVELANQRMEEQHARRIFKRIRIDNFLDFPEPGMLSLE